MKPPQFEYVAPTTVDQAVKTLAGFQDAADAKVLAGGQSLMPLLNLRLARPTHVVDLNGIDELNSITVDGDTVAIGAMCRQRTAERSRVLQERCPLLVEALHNVAHPQIRNRGTVGGSLAHADPAAELPTVALCLGAELVVRGPQGSRIIPAADFFLGFFETALGDTEILTSVRIPAAAPNTGTAFLEVARRDGDFAMVGAAVWVKMSDGVVSDASIVLSGVGLIPVHATAAEDAVRGVRLNAETLAAAAAAAAAEIRPAADLHASREYRKHVAGVLVRRGLQTALSRVEEN